LAAEDASNWVAIACLYIFRPDVWTKYRPPIFDVTLKKLSLSGQVLGRRKVEHPGAEPESLRKNWWQVEKFWAAARCVYIPRPEVRTKYRLLIPVVIFLC
jgi:hypothetical protein